MPSIAETVAFFDQEAAPFVSTVKVVRITVGSEAAREAWSRALSQSSANPTAPSSETGVSGRQELPQPVQD